MKLFVFPGQIEADILELGARQVPYARTDEFGALVKSCECDLLRLTDCDEGRVIPLTASGTAAMEAVVANLVGENDRVLVVNAGTFGQRWVELVQRYPHGSLDIVSWENGDDDEKIEAMIQSSGYQVVFMQHHETSTGALLDVARVGNVCRNNGALCVVDAIGSFLADPFSMREMHVDVAVVSSQKGLCLPPGLSFVLLGIRALQVPFYQRGLYFDFKMNLESLQRGQPLFSPAALLFLQLRKRLDGIGAVTDMIDRVARKARVFRNCLANDGRSMIPEVASNCLTSFRVDGDARCLCDQLAESDWYVMPSMDADQVRVSHLGAISALDHEELYERICALERLLKNN